MAKGAVKRNGFTLIELLVVMAIIAILAAMLLSSLTRAKQQALTVACLDNLKQLTACWHLYTVDNNDLLVPNNDITTSSGTNFDGATWCPGDARYDTNTTYIEAGLLYDYNKSVAIYHCPADRSTIEDKKGNKLSPLRNRSYNLSQSVNGYPEFNPFYYTNIPWFKTFTRISNPGTTQCMLFIDENEDTLDDAEFGMPTATYGNTNYWWDMPSNRHSQGANLSFADGHVEHWRWVVPEVCVSAFQKVLPEEIPDFNRLRSVIRQ